MVVLHSEIKGYEEIYQLRLRPSHHVACYPYVFWDADAETSQGADVLRTVYNSVDHYFKIGELI